MQPSAQRDMFVENPDLLPVRKVDYSPSPEMIRKRLAKMLAEIRGFEQRVPWTMHDLRVARLLFHNMATWLPEEERDSLRAAYVAELVRLRATKEELP